MRTIIAGSRGITDLKLIFKALVECGWTPTTVISGTARGVDLLGEQWAEQHRVPIVRFPADWEKHGRSAGYIRNREMARHAEALVAIWDGKSKGTLSMIQIAKDCRLKIFVLDTSLQPWM